MLVTSDIPLNEIISEYVVKDKDNTYELNLILKKINKEEEFNNLLNTLETFLVNTNDIFRKNSVKLITLVIERTKTLNLSEEDIKKLFDFAFSKLKDVVCAPFAVRLIYFLIINQYDTKLKINQNFTNNLISSLLMNFNFERFQVPSYYQDTRYFALKILSYMINTFPSTNSKDFFNNKMIEYITTVLDAIEGERDPRNILIMFNLIKSINDSAEKDLLNIYSKNFFDNLEKYYPIEFVPPKNSPDKITADDLINSINDAFASSEFYMPFLIEEIQEKLSSNEIDTKIQVLKTIRSINEKYSSNIINQHFIKLLNLILQQILNNEDEYLHIESIVTFKEIIKRFCEELKMKSIDNLDEQDNHIIVNINKIFEKSEDLLFNSENSKNAFDAKDIIIVLLEFADMTEIIKDNDNSCNSCVNNLNFRERAFKLSLKLINTYLDTNKFVFLKNSNSILFFTLKKDTSNKKEYNFTNINSYVKNNQMQIKNLLFNLIKKLSSSNEEIECIIDIVTCFIVKTETDLIFSFTEISELFNKIFNIFRECETSIENHLGICISEIIIKYENLNNLDFIINIIEKYLKELFIKGSSNSNSNSDYDHDVTDFSKYLNILQHYFSNSKLSLQIIEFILTTCYKVFSTCKKNLMVLIINRMTKLILKIFDKKPDVINKEKELINKFIHQLLVPNDNKENIPFSVFKDFSQIIKLIIRESANDNDDELLYFIIGIDDDKLIQKFKTCENNFCFSYVMFYQKIVKLIIKKKTIGAISNIENISNKNENENLIFNKLVPYLLNKISIWFNKININIDIDTINNERENMIKIFTKISENIGLTYFNLKTNSSIEDLFCQTFNNLTLLNPLQFRLNLIFTSFILNYSYLIPYSQNNVYNINSDNITTSLLTSFAQLNSEQFYLIVESSPLFKFDRTLFNITNANVDKEKIFSLLSILKDFHQKYQKENLTYAKNTTLVLLLNIYSRFNDDYIEDNSDIVMNLCIKALDEGISLKVSSDLMKKMLKFIDKDFVRKKGCDVRKLIESLIIIIEKSDDLQIKVNLLFCIYKFKVVIRSWDEDFIKKVVRKLRPILNDKKRQVRKYCGMCVNMWTSNE